MRYILVLIIVLLTYPACGLLSSDEEAIVERICNFNVEINGIPWEKYHDNSVVSSGSRISKRQVPYDHYNQIPYDEQNDHVLNQCLPDVTNRYYRTGLNINFTIPPEKGVEDLVKNPEKYEPYRVRLGESVTDYTVASYGTIDSTEIMRIRITDIDFDTKLIRGEMDVTLIVDESYREGNSPVYNQRRLPDTLRFRNGVFEVEFEDIRESHRHLHE